MQNPKRRAPKQIQSKKETAKLEKTNPKETQKGRNRHAA